MRKTVWAVMAVVLLVAGNLYAADGDLIVEGNVGVGTSTPTARVDVDSTDLRAGDFATIKTNDANYLSGLYVSFKDTVTGATKGWQGLYVSATHDTGASISGYWANPMAALYGLTLKGSNTTKTEGPTVQANTLVFASSGNYNFQYVTANSSAIGTAGADSAGTRTITHLSAYRGFISLENSSATWNVENASIFYAPAIVPHNYGTISNTAGVVVEKQTIGTNNMGIWLKGDGAGADVVFGPNKEARIYSNAGELYAKDGAGNVTQISPHDPESGEWIYYSQNVKTGRVVRVNMEQLVKDIEKLTGKKYMMESVIDKPMAN